MNSIQEKVLFHLTGSRDLEQVNEDILAKLASSYPYFTPVQFLLASKLKATNSTNFTNQAQKAGLYFTNPYWLHYLLNEKKLVAELPNLAQNYTNVLPNKTEEPLIQTPDLPQNIEPNDTQTEAPKVAAEDRFSNNMAVPTIELVKEMMRGIDRQVLPESTDSEEELAEDIAQQPSFEADASIISALSEYNEDAATTLSNSKISNLLSNQFADFKKPLKAEEQLEITKEPMHTVDYFASQGIKIDLSTIPQDKLTTQLRRFTDWLKYMKKDNPNPIDLGTHQDLEEAVEIIANTSNEQKEIVTETMAEVLQKQGQNDKAIQLYIKLSFLNPEKSAYFAAKIQHLKGIQ
jgi:hypothetical protein